MGTGAVLAVLGHFKIEKERETERQIERDRERETERERDSCVTSFL